MTDRGTFRHMSDTQDLAADGAKIGAVPDNYEELTTEGGSIEEAAAPVTMVGPDDNVGRGKGNYQDVTAEEQADTSATPARRAVEDVDDNADD